jgi:hypothetical protein
MAVSGLDEVYKRLCGRVNRVLHEEEYRASQLIPAVLNGGLSRFDLVYGQHLNGNTVFLGLESSGQ